MLVQMFCIHCYHHHQVNISCDEIGDYGQPNIIRNVPHLDYRECISNLKSKINDVVMSVNNLQEQVNSITDYLLKQQNEHLQMFSRLRINSLEVPWGLEMNRPS